MQCQSERGIGDLSFGIPPFNFMIAYKKTCVKKAGAGLPEDSRGAEMAARGEMKKQPLPQGRERLRKDTSIIRLQHSTEQFEGKEKASS